MNNPYPHPLASATKAVRMGTKKGKMNNTKYLYKDGTEAKAGDIIFYSEYDGKNNATHYADSIQVFVDHNSTLKFKAFVSTTDNAKTFFYSEDKNEVMPDIIFGCDDYQISGKSEYTLRHCTKIGERQIDDYMLTAEYANEKYSLVNQQ